MKAVGDRRPDLVSEFDGWTGTTYYGRPQLKPWPFEPGVVGSYIFLAGLSGSAQILATVAEASRRPDLEPTIRRGRKLALLAPSVGAALLVYDLHTPERFYNMLRVAKSTSPMSIGTWILMSFSAASTIAIGAEALARRWPAFTSVAALAGGAGAVAGAGLCTYTAALLSATSTPAWAAAPVALAMRFASSSVASGAAALSLAEARPAAGRVLDDVALAALAVEAVATAAMRRRSQERGVEGAYASRAGAAERLAATAFGVALPLGLLALSRLAGPRRRGISAAAAVATLAGSAALRVSLLTVGNLSAERPDVSFRFSTPRNLPAR